MARTLSEIRDVVLEGIARKGDTAATTLCTEAINMAIEIIVLSYGLPEFRALGSITFTTGENELDLSASALVNDIINVYNTTDSIPMGFISLELINTIVPTTGLPRVWSRDGNSLLVRPTPTADTALSIRYSTLPSRISEDSDSIPFAGYESQLLGLTSTILYAFFEEVDSSALWQKIVEILNVPATASALARKVIEGIPALKETVSGGN